MPNDTSYPPSVASEKVKVEETVIDNYVEEDRASSIVNEFGHGNGNFLTAYFNVVCVVAGTGTLGLPKVIDLDSLFNSIQNLTKKKKKNIFHLI